MKRSSSLKLPSSIRRSNSGGKDASIKKSQSVKRSGSFRLRFFKLKSSSDDDKKKEKEKVHLGSDFVFLNPPCPLEGLIKTVGSRQSVSLSALRLIE